MDKQDRDHHSNQKNPNNEAYKAATDNRANVMNPNNPAYESSRQGSNSKFTFTTLYPNLCISLYFKNFVILNNFSLKKNRY